MILTQSMHATWPLLSPKREGGARVDGGYCARGGL
jgi:hypothetical protein